MNAGLGAGTKSLAVVDGSWVIVGNASGHGMVGACGGGVLGKIAQIACRSSVGDLNRYAVTEEACIPSPHRRVREKQYARPALGVVLSGCFEYRAQSASATAVPGTVIFGNLDEHFCCRHRDAGGNRRLVVTFDGDYLEEIAAGSGLSHARFPVTVVPPGRISALVFGRICRLARSRADHDESACELAAAALQIDQGPATQWRVSPRNQRRVLAVVRQLETSYRQPCSLVGLATQARLSPYYFLRTFKKVTGQSPAQYVRNARLRAAANDLLATRYSVAEIAFSSGFNDISHFNASFRAAFGRSPTRWRSGST
jgi:AraC family transcriptional regulator